jgi:Flp pilus assembly protein TadG
MKIQNRYAFVTVWVILTLAALLLLIGLAVDTSHAYTVGRQLQNAADSAALAAAAQLTSGTSAAQAAAVTAAASNKAAGSAVSINSASDVVFGAYNSATGAFSAGATPYNAVQVTTRMTSSSSNGAMPLSFGRLVGLNTANVTRVAVAYQDTTQGSGVVVINNSGSTSTPYTQTSTSTVSVSSSGSCTGGVWVNSHGGSGGNCSVTSGSSCSGTHLHCAGGCTCDQTSCVPSKCITGCGCVSDPCSNLCEPSSYGNDQGCLYAGWFQPGQTQTCSSNGGYFSQGIYVQNKCTLNLSPGTYIVGPNGINVDNGCTLNAPNCTFILTRGGSGNQCGCLNLSGGCNCNITAPTSGTYCGCSVCCCDNKCSASTQCVCCGCNSGCDHNNPCNWGQSPSNNTCGNICISGTVYCPNYNCHCCGCGCNGGCCHLGNQVICDSMTVDTGSQVTVDYDGRNPVGTTGMTVNLVK